MVSAQKEGIEGKKEYTKAKIESVQAAEKRISSEVKKISDKVHKSMVATQSTAARATNQTTLIIKRNIERELNKTRIQFETAPIQMKKSDKIGNTVPQSLQREIISMSASKIPKQVSVGDLST